MSGVEIVSKQNVGIKLFKVAFGMRETSIMFIIIFVSALLSVLTPHFLSANNLTTSAIGMAADGIIAIGMTVALVSGAFDLSVGSIMGLSSVAAGGLYIGGMDIWLAAIVGIAVGVLCGVINGYFIGKVGLNPFITTLAMMGIARGASFVFTQGSPLSLGGVPASFKFLGGGKLFGLPFIVFLLLVILIACDFMMRRSEPFRKVFYLGSNEKAAVLSGINVAKVKMGVFILSAFLASIAGILALARFNVATPTMGVNAELRAISAAVIGGTSLRGGEGSILGAILGVVLINLINNGLILLNVSVYWQELVSGLILLLAVTIDFYGHKRKMKNVKLQKN